MQERPRNLNLSLNPVHLGLNAAATSEPEFTGVEWYDDYIKRHQKDGREGRLVSIFTFHKSWDAWEKHPEGHEVVICVSGELTLIQELDGKHEKVTLRQNEYAINPPGVWHTADVQSEATALFITPGMGTEHRPR